MKKKARERERNMRKPVDMVMKMPGHTTTTATIVLPLVILLSSPIFFFNFETIFFSKFKKSFLNRICCFHKSTLFFVD